MINAYTMKFKEKGIIKTTVLKKWSKKGQHKNPEDLIHVLVRASDGEVIMDADITDEEAAILANALLTAYSNKKLQEWGMK